MCVPCHGERHTAQGAVCRCRHSCMAGVSAVAAFSLSMLASPAVAIAVRVGWQGMPTAFCESEDASECGYGQDAGGGSWHAAACVWLCPRLRKAVSRLPPSPGAGSPSAHPTRALLVLLWASDSPKLVPRSLCPSVSLNQNHSHTQFRHQRRGSDPGERGFTLSL